jgi:hypothetical protein
MDGPERLLLAQRIHATLRARHYSHLTERAYTAWIRRFIEFHRSRDPVEMGADEIGAYLTYLAIERKVAPPTQNQALNALLPSIAACSGLSSPG